MAINPLSGSFQPPSQSPSGNSLPNKSTETERVSGTKQTVAIISSTIVSQEGQDIKSNTEKVNIAELNSRLEPISQNIQRGLRFQIDDITGNTVISVIDRDTDETIRQIPSEEMLNLSRRLKEMSEDVNSAVGILIQTNA